MIGRCGITPEDTKDIEQMLLIRLFSRRGQYDSSHKSGLSCEQFTNFILDKTLASIIEARRRDKRSIHITCLSLDYYDKNEEGDMEAFGEQLPDESPLFQDGRTPAAETTDLRIDVNRILAELTRPQREIGDLLRRGYRPSDICRKLGRSRATLDREIVKMRFTLYESGLHDYINPVISPKDAVDDE